MSPPVPSQFSQPSKPQRVLACVRCQHRKVKCDRCFPCSNCKASHAQCVPATLTPRGRRKRRFPERELLERLRKYEDLLRQNNINFEPLHRDPAGKGPPNTQRENESDDEHPGALGADPSSPEITVKSERVYEAKNFLHALNSGYHGADDSDCSHDDMREVVFRKSWVQLLGDNDYLLFGSPNTNVDLSTLHPEPIQIFRLWQMYLENVDPLLKVTHAPSMQGRIIEAASSVSNISPNLEALMFSIYSMAILSLAVDDCQAIFGSSQEDLLTRFQFGCRQALLNCGFLRSVERDCLTALYLYLVSVRPRTVPQSLSAMLGVAIRIAQRMGIHSESALARCSALEAELLRRLWWSLVLFDARISEMAEHKISTLAPTWDCRIPLNVSDSDLRSEMKEPPSVQGKATDALFAVVRSELGDFVRHTMFHLDFTSPALKPIVPEAADLATLEKLINEKYLKFCDEENPLHFMTIWWTRSYLAKCRLLEHHSKYSCLSVTQTDAQRDNLISIAILMLECDTKLRSSPLTKPFRWLVHLHFAAPAYLQIAQELRMRPSCELAEQAWEAMSDNFEAVFVFVKEDNESPIFRIFTKMILHAWEAREATFSEPLMPPRIVSSMRHRLAQIEQKTQIVQPNGSMGTCPDTFPLSMDLLSNCLPHDIRAQGGYGGIVPGAYANMPGLPPISADVNSLDWAAMDWGFGGVHSEIWDAEL